MSTLDSQHFASTSMTDKEKNKHIGHHNRLQSKQKVAASLAADMLSPGQVLENGIVTDLFLVVEATPGAGESMTFDVLVNAASILSAVFTLDATADVTRQISLLSLVTAAGMNLLVGDSVTCTRVYTAGGTPAPLAGTTLVMEYAPSPYMY